MMQARKMVFPVVLIIVGVLLLAHNLGYLRFADLTNLIGTWWPLILIAVGVAGLMDRADRPK